MRSFLLVSVLVLACASKQSPPDGQIPDGQTQDACTFSVYTTPGCGQAAVSHPLACDSPDSACLTTVCTCDGQTKEIGCAGSLVPFASSGACDGGTD